MSDNDRKRIAAECFRKGTEAMNKENWDYAIDMFSKSMLMEADNLMFRQTRHGCIRKKYKDNGTGAKMAGMKLMKFRGKIKKALGKEEWDAADKLAEEAWPLTRGTHNCLSIWAPPAKVETGAQSRSTPTKKPSSQIRRTSRTSAHWDGCVENAASTANHVRASVKSTSWIRKTAKRGQ